MNNEMWSPWFTKLLLLLTLLLTITVHTRSEDKILPNDNVKGSRLERDLQGVTTVLLASARPGKFVPPVGLLTKTARTFVQDGASTEFATQVLGTTLDNGRLYARILSTSSRVFYDKELNPDPAGPYIVYPSRTSEDDLQFKIAFNNAPIKAIKEIEISNDDNSAESTEKQEINEKVSKLEELSRENDVFNRRELNLDAQGFKPTKVRQADNLPTYTVKHEYISSNFDSFDDTQIKNLRPRMPKIFKLQTKVLPQKKLDARPLATVTYHGFADFTTTVGDTVIIFSPSTSSVSMGRPATTIKGDATLRPNDGVAVLNIKPTTVLKHARTGQPLENQRHAAHESNDQLLSAINRGNIQPSITEEAEIESSAISTEPLLLIPDAETGSLKPTGLLKVVDSTTSLDGTTTHYKSHIYGTYIGTNYAQIIHTSSNVYFFPDETTMTYETDDTTAEYDETETKEPMQDTTVETLHSTTSKTKETSSEINDLTTPLRGTTDSVLTTLKDILENARKKKLGTTESTLDDEIPNDIASGDLQGRSIKSNSNQNNLRSNKHKLRKNNTEEKVTLATKLLPSTVHKTFTYFTTFFIPDDNDQTTTSIRSREVVSSEVIFLTELIRPSSIDSSILPTTSNTKKKTLGLFGEVEEEQTTKQDEEIELIFKTLYTTYTYLTTFFQENTSSVSSRQVVETNIITQTVGPNGVSAVVAGLFGKNKPILISPSTTSTNILSSVTNTPEVYNKNDKSIYQIPNETTEDSQTTFQDQETTINEYNPTESITIVDNLEVPNKWTTDVEPSFSSTIEAVKEQFKTYYTTYTYFTTIFVDDETEIETRTEVFTNIITETITPTAVQSVSQETTQSLISKLQSTKDKSSTTVPPEILAYLGALQRQKSQQEALLLAKKVKQQSNIDQTTSFDETTTIIEGTTEPTTEISTTLEDQSTEHPFHDYLIDDQVTPNPLTNIEVLGSMITDVVSSSSSGGGTVLDIMDKRNAVPEDQELSESNNHEVEPGSTLLLQTSYTTFTYFTTMYKGDQTKVASRLETITNVVTETLKPSLVEPVPTSTLPVTYFTTFTYWTTFYKDGDTITTSREETVSNVVSPGVKPTPTVELGVIMTYRPTVTPSKIEDFPINKKDAKITADNEIKPLGNITPKKSTNIDDIDIISKSSTINSNNHSTVYASAISPEPTTFYTTFTYFTTSYIGDETILNSRLETVTSVSTPDITTQQATGRAINGPVYPSIQTLNTDEKTIVLPSKSLTDFPKTGLISTIHSSKVYDGITTHYMTDVYGTYIDGLYAQVVESSTRIEAFPLNPSVVTTPVLPTGVLSLNKGSVIDADEVTTVYFTTKQIGTFYDELYAKVIESTSSTKINEEKKASILPVQGHRTGLVRLIKGQIENNGTTTFYQSKVIGTSIEGRYAQIIESTSSFLTPSSTVIASTSTLPPSQSTRIPGISPSPAVIQSSLSEDFTTESDQDENSSQNEDDEEDNEDENGQSSKKKSRLTFSTRKRTFMPVIRPFASRNRPTFNPKRKGAQAATTITRTDITPTITATLAGKGNRFVSSRNRITSPIGPYSSTLSPSSSRRFSGRRGSLSSTSLSFSASSTRSRGQPRITPTSVFQSNRRGPTSIRGSSARAASRTSSSTFPSSSSRYRSGIRPSLTLLRGQTARHEDQENDANEFTTTMLTTDETLFTEYIDSETATTPLQTTTESSRRSTNPLLRFRRPINLNGNNRSTSTSKPPSSTTPRRSGNLNRSNAHTASRVNNTRTNTRTISPISSRTRQSHTGLFPPRGFLGRKQELPVEETTQLNQKIEGENEQGFEDEAVEEISDNDYEGSEHEDKTSKINVNRRSGKAIDSARNRLFLARARRIRRQASQLRTLNSRFRTSTQPFSTKLEDRSDSFDDIIDKEDSVKPISKPVARYNNRGRSLTTSWPYQKIPNNTDQSFMEAMELSTQQNKSRSRSKQSNGNRNGSIRIQPSSASSNNRQFTLREKDAFSNRLGYNRPSSGTRTPSRTNESGRMRSLRLRTNSSKFSTESLTNNRRSLSRTSSRSSNGRNVNGRRVPTRGRNNQKDIRESPTIYPDFDGTITVTHYVPKEVTISVVNNGITEHRNIITAHPSTEVLAPSQYSTVIAADGKSLIVIVSQVMSTNLQGQTEVTRFLLHETPTTRISHILTNLAGRRVSQSVIVPTAVYSVENIISTVQPSLPGNAPLANILLSQLLLNQLGQPNPLLQSQATPTTQYNTRTTSYVTTITKHQSTVIPLTFRGKEILTTLVDFSTNVVTATEFITDTVVVTPTTVIPTANLNSLLLLLQQQQPQSQNSNSLLDPLFTVAPFTQSNTLPGEVERRHQPVDSDYKPDNYEYFEEEEGTEEYNKRAKSRSGRSKSKNRKVNSKVSSSPKAESSVVTLYVSGRRPGEFSTVLSTVKIADPASASRKRRDILDKVIEVRPSKPPSLHAGPAAVVNLAGSENPTDAHAPTQSLESVVDDFYNESVQYGNTSIERKNDDMWSTNKNVFNLEKTDIKSDSLEETARKRVRIRVPVVRSRNSRQHKLTVVRRRPLASGTKNLISATQVPREIVLTHTRNLESDTSVYPISSIDSENFQFTHGKHKLTITRRRKLQSTPILSTSAMNRVRITRKKLLAIRPILPTPTFAVITTGFFTVSSSSYNENYSGEEYNDEIVKEGHFTSTPNLEETPNLIDNKPNERASPILMKTGSITLEEDISNIPVIITDNFFFPLSDETIEHNEEVGPRKNNDNNTALRNHAIIESSTIKVASNKDIPTTKFTSFEGSNDDKLILKGHKIKETTNLTNNIIMLNISKPSFEYTTFSNKMNTMTFIAGKQLSTEDKNEKLKNNFGHFTEYAISEIISENPEEIPTVQPLQSDIKINSDLSQISHLNVTISSITMSTIDSIDVAPLETIKSSIHNKNMSNYFGDSYIPSVIPLSSDDTHDSRLMTPETFVLQTIPVTRVTSKIASPTPEEIEAGLADDLYLSLSRLDFPEILPSKLATIDHSTSDIVLESSTSIYYTETVVTSTRLRTYTYVVTQLNGLETKVTSSTTVRPRVTTLTLTVPITVTVSPIAPTMKLSANLVSSMNNPVFIAGEYEARDEEEGRKFNLATRVMSNGVEVIVAGPTPALRWENSYAQPTLTLSDTVVMLLPQDKLNEFVTKTCTTTFTYLSTITKDGMTTVSTEQQVVANTATEERHRKSGSETAAITLEGSPVLRTEVFKTTYTYLSLNTDHPNMNDAFESSTKVITNTITAPQHYLDTILEPSEVPQPETNTYLSTRVLEKTFIEEGQTKIEAISDTITQLIVTESAPPPRPTSVTTTLTALDNTDGGMTDMTKTYYITYTYFNTFLEKGSTVVRTNIATSTDVVLEKVPMRKTTIKTAPSSMPEPIQIFATKTYLTTYTYFTTLLQAGQDGKISTTISSRSHIVENVVTESIAPSLLDGGYMNALLTTVHHSDPVKNVVTGSTIIFFDEEEQINPTQTKHIPESTSFTKVKKDEIFANSTTMISMETLWKNDSSIKPINSIKQDNNDTMLSIDESNKQPSSQSDNDHQVNNLLSLGSLGINSLSALGPVFTAMAGLLQGKMVTRKADASPADIQEIITQRSPIYIPVAEFADGDIETAESQHIAVHLANLNHNHIAETRHKVTSSLADGIPISPGEIITANSDVIIGKPGKMAPRPPQSFLKNEKHIGMKPPPLPVPNLPVHPILEVTGNNRDDVQAEQTVLDTEIQILPSHQIYEEHLKVPVSIPLEVNHPAILKQPQKLHSVQSLIPKKTGPEQNILKNDPLLKPPNKPIVEQYINPNLNHKLGEWNPEKYRRPWSAKDPLTPSLLSTRFDKIHPEKPIEKPRPTILTSQEQKRPLWVQKEPLLPSSSIIIQGSESKYTEPIVHQIPHIIDRSTEQHLLVNIQPSQVANIVIPQEGTQALVFGDANEPHISGQYFDDPSPYPEPEVGPSIVGIQKVQDLPQYLNDKVLADYMLPPSLSTNFKPTSLKIGSSGRPHTIPLSPLRIDYPRPDDTSKIYLRNDKRPSEIHLIKRPNGSANSNQSHVHTEILVHQKPETTNGRPQFTPHSSIKSYITSIHQSPVRNHFPKGQNSLEQFPPRRTEVSTSTEVPHRYIFFNKPDFGNEIALTTNWRSDKKPIRFAVNNHSRPRPTLRSTTTYPLDRHVHIATGYPLVRKPTYSETQIPIKTPNSFILSHRPLINLQSYQEPTQIPFKSSTLQSNYQDELLHTYSGINNIVILNSSEYQNPSHIELENNKHSQVSATKPQGTLLEDYSKKWQFNMQTEQTLLDSAIDASEYINYHNIYKGENKNQIINNQNKKIMEEFAHSQNSNQSLTSSTPYGTIFSVNTAVEKPFEVAQETTHDKKQTPLQVKPIISFDEKTTEKPYYIDFYMRPYELPIVQGKPFGVYNNYIDLTTPYGYKGRPNHEIKYGIPFSYNKEQPASINKTMISTLYNHNDTLDLKPPIITSHLGIELDRLGKPQSRPIKSDSTPVLYFRPETYTKTPIKLENRPDYVTIRPGNVKLNAMKTFINQTSDHEIKLNQNVQDWNIAVVVPDTIKYQQNILTKPNSSILESGTKLIESKNNSLHQGSVIVNSNYPDIVRVEQGVLTRVHPEYPQILTKSRLQVPKPIIVSSNVANPETHGRPNIKFSMSVEAKDKDIDSKTQTERPLNILITKNNLLYNKKNNEVLETAYQTNFALAGFQNKNKEINGRPINIQNISTPSRNMMPPPLNADVMSNQSNENGQEGLKPPPPPRTDVLGLSPPPVGITTTHIPMEDRFSLKTTSESGLKPPKYILLKESMQTVVPLPSTSMLPPNSKPSLTRPFLVELLSQDMVPPPPMVLKTTRPLEIATIRPAVAVSGSIQIATAVATSHIPVVQGIESKIPIIHGTVDLPVVVDVPEILKPAETRMTEHISVYTVRPFDTRLISRISIQSTLTNLLIPTKSGPFQMDYIQPSKSSTIHRNVEPTKSYILDIPQNPTKESEHPIFLESSQEGIIGYSSTRMEPTESLIYSVQVDQKMHSTISQEGITNTQKTQIMEHNIINKTANKELFATSMLMPMLDNKPYFRTNDSIIQFTKNVVQTTARESDIIKSKTNATVYTQPKEVTRFKTSTVTRTKTSVLGSPPTTRTLLLTHTITTTTVETVTETLLRPTSILSTVTSTILQPIITKISSPYDNEMDNDSIFVVMSDQNPPMTGAAEIEAEYGEDIVSRDEQDPANNEIHKVLAGVVLGAPIMPLVPVSNQCTPECRSSKSEICAEIGNETKCICRTGFSRMFPDRPCKPTYTYTLRVGLDRIGHEPIIYETALNDSTSVNYKRLAVSTKDALDRTLMQSDLRDIYRGLKIAGFIPNPTKVEFHLQLSDNTNETRLKEVIRKYLVGNNYNLGGTEVYALKNLDLIEAIDFDECNNIKDSPHHDCSPHAACFNLRGSYQCSCREGWADLSENPTYPGRICSQAPLGCSNCNNKGHCITNSVGQEVCECFPWHSGQHCQVNLKVLLIALVTTGAILLGLLAVCIGLTCFRRPSRKRRTGDRRAMIPRTGGDTSSEGSMTDLPIPHHVPHVLPPPPQMIAPSPPNKRPLHNISGKPRHIPRKPTIISPAARPIDNDQRDRSLTVMIPRAKYRSAPQSPQNYKAGMSTFATEEHKLINYLDNGPIIPENRKQSISNAKNCMDLDLQGVRNAITPIGALVSAGFQVSATVTRTVDAESTLVRSCGETTVQPVTKILRSEDLQVDLDATLARSCGETTIQAPMKLLRLDLGESSSTLARSFGETTIQPPTKVSAARRNSGNKEIRDNRDTRDSASEGHTMAERDLGSTLRLPAQHPPLYNPDRTSDRESNFDSL